MQKSDLNDIREKLNLVVDKLLKLDETKEKTGIEDFREAVGYFKRDFGIKEWDWPQGIGLYGLMKLQKIQGNEDYKEFLIHWFKENMEQGLPSRNINTTAPLLALVDLNESVKDWEFEALCLDWANWLMKCLPRTEEGGFQHVTSANGDRLGVRLNENEMWIDTLFMTVLFLNKMGLKYNRQDWQDEAYYQVLMHIKYLYDKSSGLFHHGWTFNERNNFGGVFWCRGNSWFTVGILEYMEMFKGTMNSPIRQLVTETYKSQVQALIKLQSKNGLWHTVLDDKDSYEEVSGSAAIAAGIIKGIKMGILDDTYLECAYAAIRGILKNIDKEGTVLHVSGGTGMGRDKEHYKNILIAPMAYGQSLTILALCEAINL
ncbi:glycoside hydrolase family 88 protein [Lacrimispora sp.]|uniref:glycoside hydrolase family 88/105 protein n=1 Tax=Lacrimispora sp. TaxID=2719234 RepID=UPI0032E521CD